MFPAGEGGGSDFSSDQMKYLFDYPAYHTGEVLTPLGIALLAFAGAVMLFAHR